MCSCQLIKKTFFFNFTEFQAERFEFRKKCGNKKAYLEMETAWN